MTRCGASPTGSVGTVTVINALLVKGMVRAAFDDEYMHKLLGFAPNVGRKGGVSNSFFFFFFLGRDHIRMTSTTGGTASRRSGSL